MSSHPTNLVRDCADDLALTVGELLSIARTAPKRYFVWQVDKRSGAGKRTICHPARELKAVQYYFLHRILFDLPVHPAATAYVSGSSIKKNATVHAESRVIMKLDFSDFFTSLKVSNWKQYAKQKFREWSDDELEFSCRILFWGIGTVRPICLAIGAPTSPLLSNALMYEVDVELAKYADANGLKYSRYADDITFSSKGWLDYELTLEAVKRSLLTAKNSSIRINEEKTVLVSNKFARRITGLNITPDNSVSLGRDRKRLISAMVHRVSNNMLPENEFPKLVGLLSFALDVEPSFVRRMEKKYSYDLICYIMRNS